MFSDSTNSVSAHTVRRQAPSALAGARSWMPRASADTEFWKIIFTWVGIAITIAASTLLALDLSRIMGQYHRAGARGSIAEQVVFVSIVYFLIYGNLVFLVARIGYLRRHANHRPASRSELEQ